MAQTESGGAVRPAPQPSSKANKALEGQTFQEPRKIEKSGPEASKPKAPKAKSAKAKSAKAKTPKEKPRPLTRSEVMARIRSRDTKPELTVRKALWAAGYRYRLHDKKLPGKPDLTLGRLKTAIFVHGCFWHAHQDCPKFRPPKSRLEYWSPKLEKNKSRDIEARKKLEAEGWRVVTIWECQLEKPDWLEKLLSALKALEPESLE
ncbi:MAG: very short patch repair endonuclease [Deltaproteobacteria bacterium]|jgi:DNA mismatch endonuclease (patch repair protein)|nr:very short patch repair endonuclease [Deltaproteobacteria bacterium]